MIKKKKISVIIPVYNAEKYIFESLNSIINQTFRNFELIIINDNSSDNSLSIIKKFKRKYIKNDIKILNNKKRFGIAKTLNKGINFCKGELIARMDADDISHIQRLEKQISFLNKNPKVGLLGTNSMHINEEGMNIGCTNLPLKDEDIRANFFFLNPFNHQSIIFRKSLLSKKNYNETFSTTQDYEFYSRIIRKTSVANLKEYLIKQRIHNKSISFKKKNIQLENTLKVQSKYYNLNMDRKFKYKKYHLLNKYFLGDKDNFISGGLDISSTCIDIFEIYREIQNIEKNNYLEKFFLSKFMIFLFYSFGEKQWYNFFKLILANSKIKSLINILFILLYNRIKRCVGY